MSTLKVDKIMNLANDERFGPVLGTPVAAAGQTSIDFTGIPSWAKKVTVSFLGLSTTGTSPIMVQIGPVGGVETSSYAGGVYTVASWSGHSTGFLLQSSAVAANLQSGTMVLTLADAATNTWVMTCASGGAGSNTHSTGGGYKALAGVLNKLRVTTAAGTDTFDAGSVNVMWE